MTFPIGWGANANITPNKSHRQQLTAIALSLQLLSSSLLSSLILINPVKAEPFAPVAKETPKELTIELEEIPEEVLRTEIYTDARSPIDGNLLTAAEYTELMDKLRSLDHIPPEDFVSPQIREVIGLLRLRKFFRQIIPFMP
ncbi:MAG: hypothetical protein NW214_10340 [Pseudanabaenaceae cyanobacterium bins.39]|nr:hypothetical protein [Pseudanabaenaceae cyanobacterium bins.39]